ncbi:hypothetical protein BVRB_9g215120 [Beta vulgaris subsp. vulgaris]|nr:hypothetical protein BVRB_9g215120 [Beta vulgaris subsp. vulgaris]
MAFHFFYIHFPFITFMIFLAVRFSNGEDENYAACSTLYSCGNISNVGYPFWGGNRPQFCGIRDLHLLCDQNSTTMNVFQTPVFPLSVIGIDTSSHIMNVSEGILLNHCYLQHMSNIYLLPSLKPDSRNIRLYYGCTNCSSTDHHSKSFNCSEDSTYGTAYYFNEPSGINKCSCKNNVTFQVDKRVVDELRSTNNASIWSVLTKWPIRTAYVANFTACSKCEESGGRCGSSGDPSSNQFVCHCRDGPQSQVCSIKKNMSGLLLGLGIGGGALLVLVFIVIWLCKNVKLVIQRASLDCSSSELEKGSIYFGVPLFSYSQLVEATANFDHSRELGTGGYGIVYYGKLKDGREVAVKRLYEKSCKRVEQFMNEAEILTRLRHQNLVSLYGCTSQHCRELILVYEYVKNGTVADHLYGKMMKSGLFLPWNVRLTIAIETATALSYLHASDIIHRDVKTNNILLDGNFSVKVADFGLSRLFPTDVTHVSTAPQGTPGYLDPQYHQCYKLTDKSDVYSFGVVLIELISSLPAIDMDRHDHEINLSNYAINRIQRCAFDELVDPQLGFALNFKVRRMTTLVGELAFQCLQHEKELRPTMNEVLEGLKGIEGADYEALQTEEMAKNADVKLVETRTSIRPSSPTDDGNAHLLNNHRVYLSSPISVIDKWVSKSTTYSSSK